MAKEKQVQEHRIDRFFSGPGARPDNWRFLVEAAKAWSEGSGNRDRFDAARRTLDRPRLQDIYEASNLVPAK
jgi:arginine decarboxylase